LLFAVMLTQRIAFQQILRVFSRAALFAVPVMVALCAVVVLVAFKAEAPTMQALPTGSFVGPLAAALLSTYLLPFEVVSLLLLGALVGAIILARKEED
jgi:NADH:ubiquinone oxidoreductase subunit 6 (subunit J)